MSTDYIMHIHRKKDDKELGKVLVNSLKNIIDSEFKDVIKYDYNGKWKFENSDLLNLSKKVFLKMKEEFSKITEKKMMICMSKNRDIKESLEEDITNIYEYIDELKWIHCSAWELLGKASCIVEDLYKEDSMAYEYNAEDMPVEENEDGNGKKYTCHQMIWVDDVYFSIEALY